MTSPSDHALRELYRGALALLFPAIEDFGLVPVEAQACGTPVVGLDAGGVRDTVVDGVTGALVAAQDPVAFASALREVLDAGMDAGACCTQALRFSRDRFAVGLRRWVAGR